MKNFKQFVNEIAYQEPVGKGRMPLTRRGGVFQYTSYLQTKPSTIPKVNEIKRLLEEKWNLKGIIIEESENYPEEHIDNVNVEFVIFTTLKYHDGIKISVCVSNDTTKITVLESIKKTYGGTIGKLSDKYLILNGITAENSTHIEPNRTPQPPISSGHD